MTGRVPQHQQNPLETLTGPFVSVLGSTLTALRAPGEPRLGCLVVGETTAAPLGGHAPYSGRGFGVTGEETLLTALGETYERYSLLDLDERRTVRASCVDLQRRRIAHVTPAALLGLPAGDPDARQGVLSPLPPPDQEITWVESVHLRTGAGTLLPARYCVMFDDGADGRVSDEGHWYCATSNGAATAASRAQAGISGILELLERDAFMLMWYHRLRFPFHTPPPASRLRRRLDAAGADRRVELRLINLTEVHGVPVVIAVVRGAVGADVQFGIGGGAALTLEHAAWKAAKEALAFYAWQRKQIARGTTRSLTAAEVRNFGDHPMYYMDPEHQRELAFLFEERPSGGPTAGPVSDVAGPADNALTELVDHLAGRGIDMYAVDLTPAEAVPWGLHTHKVVSPQLIPIDWDHQARHLSHERLRDEPSRRGWRDDRPRVEDLNHAPHPFP